MPGEGELAAGCENAHVVVCVQIRRRQEESRFGEIGPARERGHLLFAQSLGGMHHRERIAAQRICRENIDLRELPTHLRRLTSKAERARPASEASGSRILLKLFVRRRHDYFSVSLMSGNIDGRSERSELGSTNLSGALKLSETSPNTMGGAATDGKSP